MDHGKLKYKGFFLLILFPLSFLLTFLAGKSPDVVEDAYSTGIYKVFSGVVGKVTSLVPFSIAEWVVYFSAFSVFLSIIVLIRKLINEKGNQRHLLLKYTSTTLALISVLYFVFVIFCGLNYYRQSYSQVLGLTIELSSKEDLEELSLYMINETNLAKEGSDKANPTGHLIGMNSAVMEVYNRYDTAKNIKKMSITAQEIYNDYGNAENKLDGFTPLPKAVSYSQLMSYANITGIYFPFTFESNINAHVPQHTIPATMLHEIAHFKGYMRENEANFIAYLVGIQSDDPVFVYSARITALSHLLNAYYNVATSEEYVALHSHLSNSVLEDFAANNTYWNNFNTPVAELSNKVNDGYLKANQQQSGVKSYGEVVDLLIAYHKEIEPINK